MKKLFLFDFDGVVADSLELYEEAVNRCLEKMGKPLFKDRTEFLEIFEENFYEGISKKGVDVATFTAVSAGVAPTLDYVSVTPVHALQPVLEKLRDRGYILMVISSNSSYAIGRMLSEFGFDRYFENVLGHEFTLSKIEKIRHAVESVKAGRDQTFYIGDTVGDILEAKEAGVQTIAATWGWHSREKLQKTNPDYLIDSPEELLQL